MSATNANQSVALSGPAKEVSKKTVSKNREEYIREVFEVLPKLEGFPLSSEELMGFFTKAAKMKDPDTGKKVYSLRAFTDKKSGDDKVKLPPKVTGYNLFVSDFKGETPPGVEPMKHKAAKWKELAEQDPEAHQAFNDKAKEQNLANGHKPAEKKKQPTLEERTLAWETEWKQWCCADPETRGQEPERPKATARGPNKPKPQQHLVETISVSKPDSSDSEEN